MYIILIEIIYCIWRQKVKKNRNYKIFSWKFNLNKLISEINKDGFNPLYLAQHLNEANIISYFSDNAGIDEKEVEKNIEELINESESIQNIKKMQKRKRIKN